MPLSLLKKVVGEWENVRDFIRQDLQHIQTYLNGLPPIPDNLPPRSDSVFSSPTPAINTDLTDFFFINQQSEAIQSFTMNLTGEPVEGQRLTVRILDNGTPRVISWGSSFRSAEAPLPTTTTANTYLYVELVWNAITSTWDCLSTGDGTIAALPLHHVTHETGGSDAITSLSASVITSGTLGLARGGTHTDLSATGGTSKFLRQATAGSDITVVQPAFTDISGTLADGQLSSNVPLKNGTNAFTGANSFATSPLNLLVGQIAFPATQNPSSNVNTLDDYEEGTWTPTVDGSSGSGITYSTQVGHYVKIGKLVYVWFNITLTSIGTVSGQIFVNGFPFTNESTDNNPGHLGYWNSLASSWDIINILMSSGLTRGYLFGLTTPGASFSNFGGSDLGSSGQIIGAVSYIASA